ncbi:MFS transporter [Salimicrobium halophilum]|uniref:Na+/melibiose symporter n=1 Tax=Salimicrobium halophilum TaxID=86666 RepID=A0A1G8RL09_9BACI|nr:MFS transporter [Salimicrobium halophilum]SDJ17050.1 Na+/melibiose symporter [Salimicrobium halophilum]
MSDAHVTKTGYEYNQAKIWQIALFAMNNSATNIYLFAIGFISYYATGIAGLGVVVVSAVLTGMRAFDGVTDPIIGYIIDKTETRFGKFMPLMLIGNGILITSFLIMYGIMHRLPEGWQLPFFILMHAIYIVGYTIQAACTRAAQTVLTNDPKQRPLFTVFDAIYIILVFTGGQLLVANYLVPKHGGFDQYSLFIELNAYAMGLSAIFTILAAIAIRGKDRKEFYGLGKTQNLQVKFKDYLPVLKENRPLQMLVIAASSDKLAMLVLRQPAIPIMFFGIWLGDYALSGTMQLGIIPPTLLLVWAGMVYARKRGLKRALVLFTTIAMLSFAALIPYLLFVDQTQISFSNFGLVTIGFLLLYGIGMGISTFTGGLVIPMIADVADYETYKSGRYVPGMIGTLFSLVDKMVSSLAPAIVGVLLAFIGFQDEFPGVDTPLTTALLVMTIVLQFGVPMLGWLTTLIAMKFYKLDSEKMEEVQDRIQEIKKEAKKEEAM